MLKHTHTAVLFFLIALLGSGTALPEAHAQERPALIPFMAYELGVPHSIDREPGVVNRGDFETNGFGVSINHTAVLGVMLSFPELLESRFGVIFRANIIQSDGRFTSDPYTGTTMAVNAATGIRVSSQNRFLVRATESQAQMGLLGTWRPWRSSLLSAGPWIGYRLSSNVTQTEELLSPNNAVFPETESRKRAIAAGDEITSFEWHFGGAVELMQTLPLSPMFRIAPFVGTRFDAEALFNKGMGFRAFSLEAGLGFAVSLFSGESKPTVEADSALPIAPLPEFALSAQIDLYDAAAGSKADTLRVETERIVHTRYLPLLPLLRFSPDDTALATGYRLLNREEAEQFTGTGLFDRTPAEIEREKPNIIGERMRNMVAGELRLTGLHRREESPALALKRCNALRHYLTEIWDIPPSRIRVVGVRTSEAEGGVHVESATPQLLAPLVLQWEREEFIAPRLALRKEIIARAGVEHWEIVLRQGDRIVGRLNSQTQTGAGEGDETFASLPFNDSIAQIPLDAELTVADYTGARVVAHDRLLVAATDAPQRREVYTWHIFDPALDPSLPVVNDAFLQLIARSAATESQITIEGESGRNGFGRESVAHALLERLMEQKTGPATITIKTEAIDPAEHPIHRSVVVTLR